MPLVMKNSLPLSHLGESPVLRLNTPLPPHTLISFLCPRAAMLGRFETCLCLAVSALVTGGSSWVGLELILYGEPR